MNPVHIVRRYPLVSYLVLACLVGWNSHIRAALHGADRAHLDVLPSGSYAVVAVVVLLVGGRRLVLANPFRTPSLSAVPERVTTGARHDH